MKLEFWYSNEYKAIFLLLLDKTVLVDTVKLSIFYAKDHNLLVQYYTRK